MRGPCRTSQWMEGACLRRCKSSLQCHRAGHHFFGHSNIPKCKLLQLQQNFFYCSALEASLKCLTTSVELFQHLSVQGTHAMNKKKVNLSQMAGCSADESLFCALKCSFGHNLGIFWESGYSVIAQNPQALCHDSMIYDKPYTSSTSSMITGIHEWTQTQSGGNLGCNVPHAYTDLSSKSTMWILVSITFTHMITCTS